MSATTTTIRVTLATRDALGTAAARRGESLTDAAARAAQLLAQESMGHDLAAPIRDDEAEWLDTDAG